jgi:hypothetical protein
MSKLIEYTSRVNPNVNCRFQIINYMCRVISFNKYTTLEGFMRAVPV